MYKVIVADDEPLMLEGWKTMIEWNKFGYELCGAASDGEEALELVERIGPDLLLTDIRMPGLGGLELIRELSERRNLPLKSVIVSGYAEFDYARQAMRFGVDRYVLKPIVSEEIHELLQDLKLPLDSVLEARRSAAELHDAAVQACISRLLLGESGAKEQAELLLGPRGDMPLCLLLAEPIQSVPGLSVDPRRMLDEAAERLRSVGISAWAFDDVRNRAGLLAACSPPVLLRGAGQAEGKLLGLHLYASGSAHEYESLPLLYGQASAARETVIHSEVRYGAFYRNSAEERGGRSGYADTLTMAQSVLKHVKAGEAEAAAQKVGELFAMFKQDRVPSGWMNSIMRHIADELPPLPVAASELPLRIEAADDAEEKELAVRCRNEAERVARSLKGEDEGTEHPVQAAVAYVNGHYREKMQLRELAEQLHINSVHLGREFKRVVGCGFNDYVHRLRAEEAQRLLRRTDMKISEISELLGYHDTEYFSAKFKAATGELPSAYRIREQVAPS